MFLSLFCYLFIFYILIYIYLVTMCKNNGKKINWIELNLTEHYSNKTQTHNFIEK